MFHRKAKNKQWVPPGQTVNVQGYKIQGGLIYVGQPLADGTEASNYSCLIDPTLSVSQKIDSQDQDFGYWPKYNSISPQHRAVYLNWLASGRSDPEANMGSVFLFFYGLEYRLLVDNSRESLSTNEHTEIINEILRLLTIYSASRSFRKYASKLLSIDYALNQNNPPPEYINLDHHYFNTAFQTILGQHIKNREPIRSSLALQWLQQEYHLTKNKLYQLKLPAQRCLQEFSLLFSDLYKEDFPDGLFLSKDKASLNLEYIPASSSLHHLIVRTRLPASVDDHPLDIIASIAQQCTEKLSSYSRYIGRGGNVSDSWIAKSHLPKRLALKSPWGAEITQKIQRLFDSNTDRVSISFNQLFEIIDSPLPIDLKKSEAVSLAKLLSHFGIGIAPDPRFHDQKPNIKQNLFLFLNDHFTNFDPSEEFFATEIIAKLGAIISRCDGVVSSEKDFLERIIRDNENLTSSEKESLLALLHWYLTTDNATINLSSKIKEKIAVLPPKDKKGISKILVDLVHRDGKNTLEEIKLLQQVYPTLGLDKNQVTADLHATVGNDGFVTVSYSEQEKNFKIPDQPIESPSHNEKFQLDEQRILQIREDTKKISAVLVPIFKDEEPEHATTSNETTIFANGNSIFADIDEDHRRLLNKLLQKDIWKQSEVDILCKKLMLMCDGALENINQWSLKYSDEILIENDNPETIYINIQLAKELVNG